MPDLSKLAASLTEAQREMFLNAEPYGTGKAMQWLIRWPGRVRPNGWHGREPLSLYWNPDYDSLTRKGRALRAYLKGQSDD